MLKLRKSWFSFLFSVLLSFLIIPKASFSASPPFFGKKMLVLASNTFLFNPRSLSWKAIRNGKTIKSGRASGGRSYCPDLRRSCRTPSGYYRVISKGGSDCRSSRYPLGRGGARMPYCMFFSKYYAIHGSSDVPNYNASHGCIRIQPGAARWLNQNFMAVGTQVIVQSY